MRPSDRQQLKAYLGGAASILYRNTDPTELKTFESIEKALRQKIKTMGMQKYVGRLTEYRRSIRRHSSFWIELYGQGWVVGMEFCQDIITLINENQAK